MRQLTNAQGQVTLANAYAPYGVLAQRAGSAQTSYGFTGELTDSNRLISMSNQSTVSSYQYNGLGDYSILQSSNSPTSSLQSPISIPQSPPNEKW